MQRFALWGWVGLCLILVCPPAHATVKSGTPIATPTIPGKVKPDGTTTTVDPNGTLHSLGGTGGVGPVVSKSTSYTILTGDSNTTFDNGGAVAEVDFTLPSPVAGLRFCFVDVVASQTFKIIASASVKIAIGTTNSASGGNMTTATPFSSVCLIAPNGVNNQWVAPYSPSGTWTVN